MKTNVNKGPYRLCGFMPEEMAKTEQQQLYSINGPAFVSMVHRCWKREGVTEKTQDSNLRSMPQEVTEMFPSITSAVSLFIYFFLKVPQSQLGSDRNR